jgi:hypothetical protein
MPASTAFAQLDTGTIVGTVRDQSAAVVPGATVTATQESTGTVATTVTTDKGQFVLREGFFRRACRSRGCPFDESAGPLRAGGRGAAWSGGPIGAMLRKG